MTSGILPQPEIAPNDHLQAAEALIDGIHPTAANRQVTYPNRKGLIGAIAKIMYAPGVTTLEQVDELAADLAAIGEGSSQEAFVITGGCKEPIHSSSTTIQEMVFPHLVSRQVVRGSDLRRTKHIIRGMGQYKKPRSKPEEELPDGTMVLAYMGPLINDEDPTRREPMHDRLVSALAQAQMIETALTAIEGKHVPVAHEFLSLYYERVLTRPNPKNNQLYSASADMLWGGVRTNDPAGDILQGIGRLANPNAVKIDGTSNRQHIADVAAVLNPNQIPGRSTYMLRFKPEDYHRLGEIITAIKEEDPGALLVNDSHGLTQTVRVQEEGVTKERKVRYVSDIVEGMQTMAYACFAAGVRFNGVHLETTHDASRLECVDTRGQKPTHDGNIDPQLNPQQTRTVLNELAKLVEEQERLGL